MKIGVWLQGSPGNDPQGNPIPGEVFDLSKNRRKIGEKTYRFFECGCERGHFEPDKRPCRHLIQIFKMAPSGELPPQVKLTAHGQRAWGRCQLRGCAAKDDSDG